MSAARQRVDLWLFRARFAKTRAAASRLISEGAVRLVRGGASRQLEKPSAELEAGDGLVFPHGDAMRAIRVERLAARRGPAAEARGLYTEIGEQI